MLGRTVKMAFWVGYDHLGRLMVCNAAGFLAALPFFLAVPWAAGLPDVRLAVLGAAALALGGYAALTVAAVGTAHLVKSFLDRRDGSLDLFYEGVRFYGLQAAGLALTTGLAAAVFGTAMVFYGTLAGRIHPGLGAAAAGLFGWLVLATAMTAFYAVPALVQRKAGLRAALRIGVLLTVANPLLSFGLCLVSLLWLALSVAAPPLWLAGTVSGLTVLGTCAYELLARRYAVGDEGVTPDVADAADDYLNRGVRDFLFPWKG